MALGVNLASEVEELFSIAETGGNLSRLSALKDKGVQLDHVSNTGDTALVVAARNTKADVVQELLKLGASPDLKGSDGMTPLMIVSANCHLDLAELLIKCGASLRSQDDNQLTPIQYAFKARGKDNCTTYNALVKHNTKRILASTGERKAQATRASKAIVHAISHGCTVGAIIYYIRNLAPLLKDGGRSDASLLDALVWATVQKQQTVISTLNQADITLSTKGPTGLTALHHTLHTHNKSGFQALLAKGASLDVVDDKGISARTLAEQCGYLCPAT